MGTLEQTHRFGALTLAALFLTVTMAAGADGSIKPGDKVKVVTDSAPVKLGERTLATIQGGTELTAGKVQGNWVGVTLEWGGKTISGWIHSRYLSNVGEASPAEDPRPAAKGVSDAPLKERVRVSVTNACAGFVSFSVGEFTNKHTLGPGQTCVLLVKPGDRAVRLVFGRRIGDTGYDAMMLRTAVEGAKWRIVDKELGPGMGSIPSVEVDDGRGTNLRDAVKGAPDAPLVGLKSKSGTSSLWHFPYRGIRALCLAPDNSAMLTVWGFSPDHDTLNAMVWDTRSGQASKTFVAPKRSGMAGVFSPDGAQVLLGSQRMMNEGDHPAAWLVDRKDGRIIREFKGHESSVHTVAFSRDGALVATGTFEGKVRVWRKDTGACVATLDPRKYDIKSVQFSPDGRHLLVVARQYALWYDWAEGTAEHCWEHATDVSSADVSHNGRRVVTTNMAWHIPEPGEKRGVRLWDVNSGSLVWATPFGYPLCAAFSPDSRTVLVSDDEGKIHLFSASSGQAERALATGQRQHFRLAISGDGRLVVAWDSDGDAIALPYEDLSR